MRRHGVWLALITGVILPFTAVAQAPADAGMKPGLAVHYYGNPDFWLYGGATHWDTLEVDANLERWKWPAPNWDVAKGPVFHRSGGWSLAAYGTLKVEQAGDYRFSARGAAAELLVNGGKVALDGSRPVTLAAGPVPLCLYLKSATPFSNWTLGFALRWQPPAAAEMTPIPAAALRSSTADQERKVVFNPEFPLANPKTIGYSLREYELDLPADGFYEFLGHFPGVPRQIELTLDGHFLYHHLARRSPQEYGFDFLNRCRAVRYLAKGKHRVTLFGYVPNYPFEPLDKFLSTSRFGVNRVPAQDPAATLSIAAKDREDLVFRRNEPFVVRIEQATTAAAAFSLEVTVQRGGAAAVWTGRAELPAASAHATGEIAYPCPTEGAFEAVVRDGVGAVVAGPWALAVIDPVPLPLTAGGRTAAGALGVLVDQVDCTSATDAEHKFRDNGTSRVVVGLSGKYRVTGRGWRGSRGYIKNKTGGWRQAKEGESSTASYAVLDWFAYTLKVKNPGRAHLVVAHIPNDVRRLVAVQAFDQVTGQYNAGLLDAGDAPESAAFSTLRFLMWPNGDAVDVMSFCSDHPFRPENRQGAVAKFELYELPDGLPALPAPAGGFASGKEYGWAGEQVNLGMEQKTMPRLWDGDDKIPGVLNGTTEWANGYYDWRALRDSWERFGDLSRWRGDNFLCWPVYTYGMNRLNVAFQYLPRYDEEYAIGYRARVVDPMLRDQLKMMLLTCEKYGVRFVADLMVQRVTAEYVAAVEGTGEKLPDGLFLTDSQGAVIQYPATVLNPAHPAARRYVLGLIREVASVYGTYPAFAGINIRQSGWHSNNSGWFANANFAYDDFTVGLFEKESGVKVDVAATGPDRFRLRRDWLLAKQRDAWLGWRCDKVASLRTELLAELRKVAPQARLYGIACATRLPAAESATPEETEFLTGAGIDLKKLAGNRDLGYGVWNNFGGTGIELNFSDPIEFMNFDQREPNSLRRTLDQLLGHQEHMYPNALCAGEGSSIRSHPYQLEELAKTVAAGRIDTIVYGGPWILPEVDDGIRAFARNWRAIPDLVYTRMAPPTRGEEPLVAWQARRAADTICYLANVTPRRRAAQLRFSGKPAGVQDLVTGEMLGAGAEVTVLVEPYMVAVLTAAGADGLATLSAVPDRELTVRVDNQLRRLQALLLAAAGTVQVQRGKGPSFVTIKVGQEQYDDGAWGRQDVKVTLPELVAPITAAWDKGDVCGAAEQLDRFLQVNSWWYQAFGWPAGMYRFELPSGTYASPRQLVTALTATGDLILRAVPGVPGEALCVPSGNAALEIKCATADRFELRVWMLSGNGYGPVTVTVDGKPVGGLGTGTGSPAFAHFTLPQPLALNCGLRTIGLTAGGTNGLVLWAAELNPLPPEPIKAWSAIGLFDKKSTRDGWDGFDTAFPPETEFKPEAAYAGLAGAKVGWCQIDLGADKFIQLLEKVYPYDFSRGNGVAYLATWVYAPEAREATLYYAIDWFGRVWVNDEVVLPMVSGPWKNFATQKIALKEGWNKLLVKTSCGRSSWKANFALSDPGDLKYHPLPPHAR